MSPQNCVQFILVPRKSHAIFGGPGGPIADRVPLRFFTGDAEKRKPLCLTQILWSPLCLRFFYPISFLYFPRLAFFSRGKQDLRSCFPLFPPISKKSEENPFFSPSHFMAREKNLSHRWLGKKILPFFPIPSESKERPSPQIPKESEGIRSQAKSVLFLSEKGPEKKDGSYFYRPIHGSVKIASMKLIILGFVFSPSGN